MLTYRPFRNTDPPILSALWRSRAGQPGLFQPVSSDLLEQLVFAKLYFDYDGLTLAFDGDQAVGFAHAGFGPNEAALSEDGKPAGQPWIATDAGVTCVAMAKPGASERDIVSGLLERSETYLQGRGAKVLYGGGLQPLNPFYLGLYGGSELPGVLDSDAIVREVYAARGYREVDRTVTMRRELGGFESHIDRFQMQIRRQMVVEATVDAPTRCWWQACTMGEFDLTRFDLVPRAGGAPVASLEFRSMEPSGTVSIGRAAGLVSLFVDEHYRRRGLAVFLLSEAFRQFLRQGIMHVEVQTPTSNAPALGLFQKLGFEKTAEGGVWRKT